MNGVTPEHAEEARADALLSDEERRVADHEVRAASAVAVDRAIDLRRVIAERFPRGAVDRGVAVDAARRADVRLDQREALGMRVGQRTQQDPVGEAENGRVGADDERQRRDRRQRERGRPAEDTNGVAKIANECVALP